MKRTPASYMPAAWRGVLPHDPAADCVGVSFTVGGDIVVRLALPTADVRHLVDALLLVLPDQGDVDAGDQSPGSALIPSVPRSVPSGGVKTCPPAASPVAPATVEYEPSESPRQTTWNRPLGA